jgi:hypothetical protein
MRRDAEAKPPSGLSQDLQLREAAPVQRARPRGCPLLPSHQPGLSRRRTDWGYASGHSPYRRSARHNRRRRVPSWYPTLHYNNRRVKRPSLSSTDLSNRSLQPVFELSMKPCRKRPLWFIGLLMLSLSPRLVVADISGHPYTGIAARNVFGLGPLVTQTRGSPPAPLPKIVLVGITTLVQDKRALLKVEYPAQPPEPAKAVSCILAVGQREGPIEVLAIDETAGTVRVNNSGTEMLLSFLQSSRTPLPFSSGKTGKPSSRRTPVAASRAMSTAS